MCAPVNDLDGFRVHAHRQIHPQSRRYIVDADVVAVGGVIDVRPDLGDRTLCGLRVGAHQLGGHERDVGEDEVATRGPQLVYAIAACSSGTADDGLAVSLPNLRHSRTTHPCTQQSMRVCECE